MEDNNAELIRLRELTKGLDPNFEVALDISARTSPSVPGGAHYPFNIYYAKEHVLIYCSKCKKYWTPELFSPIEYESNVTLFDRLLGIMKSKQPVLEETPQVEINPVAAERIRETANGIRDLLLAKNADYGCTAWESPVLAPDMPSDAAIRVRMSDKVARLKQLFSEGYEQRVNESLEDTVRDLAGYCILWLANPNRKNGVENDA